MFVSLKFKLELKKEDKEKLIKLMHKHSSAISAIYKAKQYPTNKPVVFGGKRLFEKLWRELRQGTLIAVGSKHKIAT
jgi:hypothetical protein